VGGAGSNQVDEIRVSRWAQASSNRLEREQRLVREAIAMVAAGAAPRVVVASLLYSAALLDPSRRLALEAGVRVRPLSRRDRAGVDLAVEPIA